MKRFIGIDLHTTQITVCYLNEDGSYQHKLFGIGDLKSFKIGLSQDDHVAFEATGNSNFLYRELKGLVGTIGVVNTKKFKVITKSCNKTDKNDSFVLAEFLSKDILPTSRVKSEIHEDIASVVETRDKLVGNRTRIKNKVSNILNRKGIKLPRAALNSNKQLDRIVGLDLNEIINDELAILVTEIKHLNEQVDKLDIIIQKHGKQLPGYDNLLTIKGLGSNAAVALLCNIGNVADFKDIKKLAAYVGLVPWVSNSNETVRHGSITKNGNPLVRKMLINCAFVAVKYNPILKAFYQRLKSAKGFGKAIVATARKLLAIVFSTLVNNWFFEDFVANKKKIVAINWGVVF